MPGPPRSPVADCEYCWPFGVADDERLADPAAAAEVLAQVAAWLRERGAIGRMVLVDGRTRQVVAARRVWP